MAKRKTGGNGPNKQQVLRAASAVKGQMTRLLDRSFCLLLANYKAVATDWTATKKDVVSRLGMGWFCEAAIDCLARVGAKTLPRDILGVVHWSKLAGMTYQDATDILSGKVYPVVDVANHSRVVRLSWMNMADCQRRWLVGVGGQILPPSHQVLAAIPKVGYHDAEGVKVLKHDIHVWYHNQRGRKKVVIVPRTLMTKANKNKGKDTLR